MSSSSSYESAPTGELEPIRSLLERALRMLAVELPHGLQRVATAGGNLAVRFVIAHEVFVAEFEPIYGIQLHDDGFAATVGVGTDRQTILAVLVGTVPLVDAIEKDRLRIVGTLAEVVQLYEALHAFMQAAVRCPSAPALLNDL